MGRMASVLSVPPDDFVNLWHAAFEHRMTGTLQSYQAGIEDICQQLGVPAPQDKVKLATSIRFEMNQQEVTTPRDGALDVLAHLKSDGYRTGLLSDCSMETTLVWENSPLSSLVDEPVFSCLVGLKKPDPRIYQIAAEKLGVSPEECIYVADGIGKELSAAKELGMYAVQILVPGEDEYDPYREEWNGSVITSLEEVMGLVK